MSGEVTTKAIEALAEKYCEGFCKSAGGRGKFLDCTGCEIAALAKLQSLPQHASDCAVHNEPAMPAGPCDCEASYVASIYARAEAEREKAQRKFPQPNFVALKVAEEAGEVIKAAVHYSEYRGSWAEVEAEAVQAIAMLMRLLVEGDQKNGIIPPNRPK